MQAQFDQPVTGPDRSKAAGFTPQYRTEGPGWRTDSVLRGTGDDVAQQWASGEYARGFGTGVRGALAAVPQHSLMLERMSVDWRNRWSTSVKGYSDGMTLRRRFVVNKQPRVQRRQVPVLCPGEARCCRLLVRQPERWSRRRILEPLCQAPVARTCPTT